MAMLFTEIGGLETLKDQIRVEAGFSFGNVKLERTTILVYPNETEIVSKYMFEVKGIYLS